MHRALETIPIVRRIFDRSRPGPGCGLLFMKSPSRAPTATTVDAVGRAGEASGKKGPRTTGTTRSAAGRLAHEKNCDAEPRDRQGRPQPDGVGSKAMTIRYRPPKDHATDPEIPLWRKGTGVRPDACPLNDVVIPSTREFSQTTPRQTRCRRRSWAAADRDLACSGRRCWPQVLAAGCGRRVDKGTSIQYTDFPPVGSCVGR